MLACTYSASDFICPASQALGSDIGSGIKCSLSKFADDTKLCGVIDTLEGRDDIQRDLGRLQRWTSANLMKFHQYKCKVLHLYQDNPKHKYRLGSEWIESSPEEKDRGLTRCST
ncbi:rna-directed dna polymerase from mobile element jockey-like [Pitangus sulphuratus]|nr:rna-directed dna polymerase from mobile element jockey-like [Pitangus sulphuratus]